MKNLGALKKLRNSLLLKSLFFLTFVPIIGFFIFAYLTYPIKPHCSLGEGIFGCIPICEPTSFFENGEPATYKIAPCFHKEPNEIQKILFRYWFLIPLLSFVFISLWIYKDGGKNVVRKLGYIAFAPIYIFKENRNNKKIISKILVILITFFLFIEWAFGYYLTISTLLDEFKTKNTPQTQTNQIKPPSFTGQEIFDAINKYRKENNVPELKLDEILCNNIAQRYLDIKSGEKENISHKGFDEWYKKYAEPYGYNVSENYACGQTPEDIIKAWSSSPSHNLPILDKKNKLACTYAAEGCAVILLGYKTSSPQVKGVQTNNENDPIVNCQISPECGGGSRQMKKSECEQSTCCQIGDKWYFYLSKDKCLEDQKNYIPTQSKSDKVPVFLSYYGYTTYCPPQNVDAVKSIDQTMISKRSFWQNNFDECSKSFYSTNPCYLECKSGDINNYGECIKKCPSVWDYCDFVFLESKDLGTQIDKLCK